MHGKAICPPVAAGFFIPMTDEQTFQLEYDVRPLYRVRRPIAYKDEIIPVGALHRLEKIPPEGIKRMRDIRQSICEVKPPPLMALPGWKTRADKLARAGIMDAVQFLGVEPVAAADYMGVKPLTIDRWKREVMEWLTPQDRRR